MLRKLLIATALLTASGTALAHSDYGYGRVIAVEPRIAISFGAGHHDGFRVLYESGGTRYWTHTSYYPGRMSSCCRRRTTSGTCISTAITGEAGRIAAATGATATMKAAATIAAIANTGVTAATRPHGPGIPGPDFIAREARASGRRPAHQ
jgi:hypothetical protein